MPIYTDTEIEGDDYVDSETLDRDIAESLAHRRAYRENRATQRFTLYKNGARQTPVDMTQSEYRAYLEQDKDKQELRALLATLVLYAGREVDGTERDECNAATRKARAYLENLEMAS